jgi:hypothetical protein
LKLLTNSDLVALTEVALTTSVLPILFDLTPLPGLSKWLPKEIIFGDFNFDIPIEPNLNEVKNENEKRKKKRKKEEVWKKKNGRKMSKFGGERLFPPIKG